MPVLSWRSIVAVLQEMGGEGVAQGVAGETIGNVGCWGRLAAHGLLKPGFSNPTAEGSR